MKYANSGTRRLEPLKSHLPSIMSCFIFDISLRISRKISCFMASSSALEAVVELEEEVALLMAFSAMPFSFVTSISSAVEPNRLRPGLGDSEPLEDFPVGEDPFSKFLRSPESSWKKKKIQHIKLIFKKEDGKSLSIFCSIYKNVFQPLKGFSQAEKLQFSNATLVRPLKACCCFLMMSIELQLAEAKTKSKIPLTSSPLSTLALRRAKVFCISSIMEAIGGLSSLPLPIEP